MTQTHIEQLADRARRAEDTEARARQDLQRQADERRLLEESDRQRGQAAAARAQAQREVDAAGAQVAAACKELAHVGGAAGRADRPRR